MSPTVLIASYLEPEHVEQIRSTFPTLEVLYRPDLLGKPRYPADHTSPVTRTPAEEAEWRALLAQANVLFDFDFANIADLPQLAPNVKWIQASSAGIGQLVQKSGLAQTEIIFTTASGVHATSLAEFCIMSIFAFAKRLFHLQAEKQRKHWARYCGIEVRGQTLAVVGLGRVGREIARLARCMGMEVLGTKRHVEGVDPATVHADVLYAWTDLPAMLGQADYVVLIVPHTPETDKLFGASEIAAMKPGAVLVNIARGAVVDEAALIDALRSGHLGGAALDVFAVEPLPTDSPLWEMQNVIISPHSASTADTENGKLTDLFCDNMRRYLDGKPLRNILDTARLY